ncbi:S8 family peptidase [Actinokineospora diospyrosa]|uniref:Subtilase family protein n=1 Tax=Actinokineospora diospyrosa TaxID=103728 RepID=A0ABT1I572_9PSEU|nr:S8 family serine peptidase [Actinokineospora diospyrosa]MCP2267755.1 Subtilase family protein [Actinokineospora diospyrosa]
MRPALALLTVTASALLGLAIPAANANPTAAAVSTTDYLGSLTLITGDHVTLRKTGGRLVPAVDPGPGRDGVQFATAGTGDALTVIPSDALPALQAGRLDRRLFDVATLLREGYGDEDRDDLPLIAPAAAPGAGLTLSSVDAKAVKVRKSDAGAYWAQLSQSRAAGRVWLDGVRKPSLDVSVRQIGAPSAWAAGWTGKGVPVAVLDTGIDATHPDLRKSIQASRDFTGEGGELADSDGHGTHVASTVAGTGSASAGKYVGVAPEAKLLIGKVCGGWGCAESAILAGIEWAVASGAKVVNLSLGGTDTADEDPLEAAVNRLSDRALFVIAAGNDGGYGAETVASPASADAALAVGAVDKSDRFAGFSSRGPRVGDAALKPEISAPGVGIVAARSKYSNLGTKKDKYANLSGTSMATPHVAGSAALLVQRHPDWTPKQLKAALIGSAKRVDNATAFDQGAGRVDVARAVTQVGVTEPPVVSIGRQPWPHDDDQPVTKKLSYVNTATVPLVLRLSLAGDPPAGMFRLSAQDITVPARGRTDVEVTVDTKVDATESVHSAWVIAEGGVERITTPVAVDREPESYDLTVHTVNAAGDRSDSNFTLLFGVSRNQYRPIWTVGGEGGVRVRKGTYHLDTVISAPTPEGRTTSRKVVQPNVQVAADTTVELNAADAKPIAIGFDRPNVHPRAVGTGYGRRLPWGTLYAGILGDNFERIFTFQHGDPIEDVVADVGGAFYVPDVTGGVESAPVTYNVAWFQGGALPTGFTKQVADGDLARVDTTYRQVQTKRSGTKLWLVSDPVFQTGSGYGLPITLPLTRTEFHGANGEQWSAEFQQWRVVKGQVITESVSAGDVVRHAPGQTYREDWNTAAFGPSLPKDGLAVRVNDTISVGVPMLVDSADRVGSSLVDTAETSLYREGELVGTSTEPGQGTWDVPEASARYRLDAKVERAAPLSARVLTSWTFTSVRPQPRAKGGAILPLMALRFAPIGLDQRNHAVGRTTKVVVSVGKQPQLPAVPLTRLVLSASFNDGITWVDVPVVDATATVTHPAGTAFVSLRANAVDRDGNEVEQTVIRAYGG